MSESILSKLQKIQVNGEKATDVNFFAMQNTNEVYAWCAVYWEIALQIASHDEMDKALDIKGQKGISTLCDIFGNGFERNYHQAIESIIKRKKVEEGIEVDGKRYSIVSLFTVYHKEWESDGDGWVVATDNGNRLVLSNHGSLYFAEKSELEAKIAEYEATLADSRAALALL